MGQKQVPPNTVSLSTMVAVQLSFCALRQSGQSDRLTCLAYDSRGFNATISAAEKAQDWPEHKSSSLAS